MKLHKEENFQVIDLGDQRYVKDIEMTNIEGEYDWNIKTTGYPPAAIWFGSEGAPVNESTPFWKHCKAKYSNSKFVTVTASFELKDFK